MRGPAARQAGLASFVISYRSVSIASTWKSRPSSQGLDLLKSHCALHAQSQRIEHVIMSFSFGKEVYRKAFDDRKTPKISYGLRFPEACLKHCHDTFSSSRVYIICSKSLSQNTDALERLRFALGHRVAGVWIGIKPHTPIADVVAAANDARAHNVDCILTLGAGSLTDAAKLVRLALANSATSEEDMNTLWGTPETNPAIRERIIKPNVPLIHIPTSLSGGEYQAIAGATETGTLAKRLFKCEGVNPELVIQDPELAFTTPQWVWLSTGIRAVDHCIETLCSLLSNERGDAAAAHGLPKLVDGLLQSKADPKSLDARRMCQEGVVDAMSAVSSGVPLGASHAIGHQLGPLGVGHGETSCILLPPVCKYNAAKNANVERQAVARDILLKQDAVKKLLQEKKVDTSSIDLSSILYHVISALEMPQTLQDVGVGEDKLQLLAKNSLDDPWSQTNPVPVTEESQVMEILQMVVSK